MKVESKEGFFQKRGENAMCFFFFRKGGVKSEKGVVFCFIQRVILVVCVKCWGAGINVGVWGITSRSKLEQSSVSTCPPKLALEGIEPETLREAHSKISILKPTTGQPQMDEKAYLNLKFD